MRFHYLKGEIVREQCTEEHSFKAVAVFKLEMDKGDKFLSYRINDSSSTITQIMNSNHSKK